MPQNFRKAMADQERLKTLAYREDLARRRRLRRQGRLYYMAALLWAVLAALPSILIGRPIPYMVGATAPHDIHSRVEFSWHDRVAEEQALQNLVSGYARRYREMPQTAWSAETYGPVEMFLTRIAAVDDMAEVEAAARELGIAAVREQLAILHNGAVVARNDPYHYLVTPIKEILDNEVFPQGILSPDRYDIERGRTIQIIRDDSSYTTMVGGERGPTTVQLLGPYLEGRFRVKLSAWIPDDFKTTLREVVARRLLPTLQFDEAGSEAGFRERREELLTRVQTINRNDILVSRGTTFTLDKLAMMREEERIFQDAQGWRLPAARFIGNFLLCAAISFSIVIYFKKAEGRRLGVLRR
ncbi:MAG: hypothetical protein LIP77_02805, partial [Planctomycetes bacterium]|nr:hypothetical protein [Planctomycetota bacterium]